MRHLCLIVLIGISTLCVANGQSVGFLQLLDEADKAISEGDWLKAEGAFETAIGLEPDNPGKALLLSNIGMLRFNRGLADEALAVLDSAVALAPRSVTIIHNRARVEMATGLTDAAIVDFERVFELDSTMTTALFAKGYLQLVSGQTEPARATFAHLLIIDPQLPEAHVGEALISEADGDFGKAAQAYTRALRLDAQPEWYSSLAHCYILTDSPGEAAEAVAKGLELDPDNGELYLWRALANKMRYRMGDARRDADRAISLGLDADYVNSFFRK